MELLKTEIKFGHDLISSTGSILPLFQNQVFVVNNCEVEVGLLGQGQFRLWSWLLALSFDPSSPKQTLLLPVLPGKWFAPILKNALFL